MRTIQAREKLQGTVPILHWQYAGYTTAPQRVTVRDGQTATVSLTATPLPARLTVTANAPSAEIFDEGGRRLGAAGSAIEVPALQTLALTVRANGYAERVERLGAMELGKAYTKSAALEERRDPTAGNVLGMVLVEVKAGEFRMGSENGRRNEKPVRTVRITWDF